MRYVLIIAGGSGTRLWPMSRQNTPKQLLPLLGGKSLLQLSVERALGLVDATRLYICAAADHQQAILQSVPALAAERFYGEPCGRDTLNAVGLAAAEIARRDPQADIAVLTADHVIEPLDAFVKCLHQAFNLVEAQPRTLITFGVEPTWANTGYGYLQLGAALAQGAARQVLRFQEKPNQATADDYLAQGPQKYLWNSGMFVWRATTLLDCLRRFAPENHRLLTELAAGWDSPQRGQLLARIYPQLPRLSIDVGVMEKAAGDSQVQVAALPMRLSWLDLGSWPSYAEICPKDAQGNAAAAGQSLLLDCRGMLLVSSDSQHLIAALGCEDLIVIHTPDATLICPRARAEEIKKLHGLVGQRFGPAKL